MSFGDLWNTLARVCMGGGASPVVNQLTVHEREKMNKQQALSVAAKEMDRLFPERGYFEKLPTLLQKFFDLHASQYPVDVCSWPLSPKVLEHLRLIDRFAELLCKKNIEALRQEAKQAFDQDVLPLEVLYKCVGHVVDVESFCPNELENKLKTYLAQVNASCSICADDFTKEELVAKKVFRTAVCKHFYHHHCVESWFKARKPCPMCRHDVDWSSAFPMWQTYLKVVESKILEHFSPSQKEEIQLVDDEEDASMDWYTPLAQKQCVVHRRCQGVTYFNYPHQHLEPPLLPPVAST